MGGRTIVIQKEKSEIQARFGTSEPYFEGWISKMLAEQQRLDAATNSVMHRELRTAANGVVKILGDIVNSCQRTHEYARNEQGLPILIAKIAEVLEEYSRTAAQPGLHPNVVEQSQGAASLMCRANEKLEAIYERMRARDAESLALRAASFSGVMRVN